MRRRARGHLPADAISSVVVAASHRRQGLLRRLMTEDLRAAKERGDALAFNQWRVTAEHRPLGEIMDVRRIYTASARVRRTLNHQPQTEPVSAAAVLP